MKKLIIACALGGLIAAPAIAGEIKGPPPKENYTAEPKDVNGRSICAFSGLNDSPLGDPEEGDPGGIAQSFGYFFAKNGFPVSALDPRAPGPHPGFACNPNKGFAE